MDSKRKQKQGKLVFAPSTRPEKKYAQPQREYAGSSQGGKQTITVGVEDSSDSEVELEWNEQGKIDYTAVDVLKMSDTSTPSKHANYRSKYGSPGKIEDLASHNEASEDAGVGAASSGMLEVLGDVRRENSQETAIYESKKCGTNRGQPHHGSGVWWRKPLPGLSDTCSNTRSKYTSRSEQNRQSKEDIHRERMRRKGVEIVAQSKEEIRKEQMRMRRMRQVRIHID